jgi:hypothetical protein
MLACRRTVNNKQTYTIHNKKKNKDTQHTIRRQTNIHNTQYEDKQTYTIQYEDKQTYTTHSTKSNEHTQHTVRRQKKHTQYIVRRKANINNTQYDDKQT